MHGHLLVCRIQIRIVAAGASSLRSSCYPERSASSRLRRTPGPGYAPLSHASICWSTRGFGISVRTRAQNSHEERNLPYLSALPIVNRNGRASPIHKHLLAGFVFLSQHQVLLALPIPVQLAKEAIRIAVRALPAGTLPRATAESGVCAAAVAHEDARTPEAFAVMPVPERGS